MDGLKQRIIGALVLICLAIIFVPMLFDEPHNKQTTKTIEIPNKPQYPVMTIEQPTKPATPGADTSAPVVQDNASASADQSGTAPTTSANTVTSTDNTATATDNSDVTTPAQTPTADTPAAATTAPAAAPSTPAPAPTPAPKAQPAPVTTQAAQPTQKPEFSQSLKGAWVVQLGSFGDTKNAQRLRDSVRAKGYPAYLQTAHTGSKALTRVFSGPFVQKADADAAKIKLDKAFKIKSLVMAGDK
ncbi:SPOR domain-containing protein [Mangrovitalea sediminis]|uniref:SPOR domain-containing protein n=1 Tax=Mangrovitalea sediminis TaxID=1982043 RepID=UPI0018EA2ED5|nr:SPOR domain-containing protein [Mangrovitalea sediminis]